MPSLPILLLAMLLALAEVQAGLLLKTPRTASPSSASPRSTTTPTPTSALTTLTLSTTLPPSNNNSNNIIKAIIAPPTTTPTPTPTAAADDNNSKATTTPAPKQDDDDAGDLGGIFHEIYGQKYTQTTYYSCVTFALETQCGWHEPILEVQGSGASRAGIVVVPVVVAVAGGLMVAGGVLGM
ncbi:hypothetical protein F4809DRAFT_646548 [Biscogniauxia mediterranea]|nr:hypothetical protein F4809DRAFT_646548 [Biscogniauxia mediterranea]